jgi:hypothetical protein
MIDTDTEFTETTVVVVSDTGGGWSVKMSNGYWLFVASSENDIRPNVGGVMRLYGKGVGYPIRGVIIDDVVYRYQSAEAHEIERTQIRARLTSEREEADAKFVSSEKEKPAEFKKKNWDTWEKIIKANSSDPYSYACVLFAAKWAATMEKKLMGGAKIADVAEEASYEADNHGITGYMYGYALSVLVSTWEHGSELASILDPGSGA